MYEVRIYTEQKNVKETDALVAGVTDSFTKYYAQGFYKGVRELTMIYEFITDDGLDKLEDLAERVGMFNGQEAVMLTVKAAHVIVIN